MLGEFGVDVALADDEDGRVVRLGERRDLVPSHIAIAADPSSAAFPLVAAALVEGAEVTVEGMLVNPRRTGLYETLERMGADISLSAERIVSGEIVADVTVRGSWLEPCQVSADDVPAMIDEIPILSMAAAMADGESVFEGLGELRHKESDRLAALLTGLTACGVAAHVDGDTLRIFGRGRVRGGRVTSHGDHRIAMAFATLGLASGGGVEVDGAEMIASSFPGFADTMRRLGANIS
jgi:3-phosphoshikimate 1-carboxyvinyltransferase